MKPEQVRARSVGCKVTEDEFEKLGAAAEREKLSLGEWCRAVLLERASGREPSAAEQSLLGEVLSLRTILLNLHFMVAKGEKVSAEQMQQIIDRADAEKLKKAARRIEEVAKALGDAR
jgi:hypothetical protein